MATVPDQVQNTQTYQDEQCSVARVADEKLDEYAAMAQALKELAGFEGDDAQNARVEAITEGVVGTAEYIGRHFPLGDAFAREAEQRARERRRELGDFQRLLDDARSEGQSGTYVAYLEREIEKLQNEIGSLTQEAARQYDRADAARDQRSETWQSLKAWFRSLYDEFMNEWRTCGLLKAVQLASARLAMFAVESAVIIAAGSVTFGAATFAIKSFKLLVTKGRNRFRVTVRTDQIDPEIRREMDNRDVGGHEPVDNAPTPLSEPESDNEKAPPRPKSDEELAKEQNDLDDEMNAKRVAARRRVARKHYKQQTNHLGEPLTDQQITQHMDGIDFDRPVSVEPILPGETYYQYLNDDPSRKWVGEYFTNDPNVSPGELGIAPEFREPAPRTYRANRRCRGLKSTSAAIDDDWSAPPRVISVPGGATQFNILRQCRPTEDNEVPNVSYR